MTGQLEAIIQLSLPVLAETADAMAGDSEASACLRDKILSQNIHRREVQRKAARSSTS